MDQTWDKEQRREQKAVLRKLYPHYDPKRHDTFVSRFNRDREDAVFRAWMTERGIWTKEELADAEARAKVKAEKLGWNA